MQEHALEALFLKRFVPFKITVFIITGNGVPFRCQVHPNLMGPTCLDGDL
jgi:hypothetical protein